VIRQFKALFKDLSLTDIAWLHDFETLRQRVYVFDLHKKEATHPGTEIPWPIVWLLARYHKKHVFCRKFIPKPDIIRQDAHNFINKIKWRWILRNISSSIPMIARRRRRQRSYCPHKADAALEVWRQSFYDAVLGAFRRGVKAARGRSDYCNLPLLTKWGIKMLRTGPWVAIPTDKDGGFAIHRRDDIGHIHTDLLNTRFYSEVHSMHFKIHEASSIYRSIAEEVGRLEDDPGLVGALNSTLTTQAGWTSSLKLTCKTNKPKGKVKHRNIHAQPDYAFGGLSMWMVRQLRPYLRLPHLVKGSREMVERLSTMQFSQNAYFMRFDLEDYYLSGTPEQLESDVIADMPQGRRRQLVSRTLWFLLDNQYVRSRERAGLWKVIQGSGQGLIHSGESLTRPCSTERKRIGHAIQMLRQLSMSKLSSGFGMMA
jgi:hypothetical protein